MEYRERQSLTSSLRSTTRPCSTWNGGQGSGTALSSLKMWKLVSVEEGRGGKREGVGERGGWRGELKRREQTLVDESLTIGELMMLPTDMAIKVLSHFSLSPQTHPFEYPLPLSSLHSHLLTLSLRRTRSSGSTQRSMLRMRRCSLKTSLWCWESCFHLV